MLFGKYINRYYVKYLPMIILGLLTLLAVDYVQLLVPEIYRITINGINDGFVTVDGVKTAFDMNFLLDEICLPMIIIIMIMIVGRFFWRVCFRESAIRMETNLRSLMFDKCKDLSQQYYEV